MLSYRNPNNTKHLFRQWYCLFVQRLFLWGSLSSFSNKKKLVQWITTAMSITGILCRCTKIKSSLVRTQLLLDMSLYLLHRGLNKLDTMTPRAFNVCIETLINHYDDPKADFELKMETRSWPSFSSMHTPLSMENAEAKRIPEEAAGRSYCLYLDLSCLANKL